MSKALQNYLEDKLLSEVTLQLGNEINSDNEVNDTILGEENVAGAGGVQNSASRRPPPPPPFWGL